MPIYEFRCEECEKPFEKLVRTFREEVACPGCGSASVERLLSTFAMSGGGSSSGPSAPLGGGCCGRGGCGCGAGH
jgi:putative FmdB family regulatory protein